MSFDLLFIRDDGQKSLAQEEYLEYFQARSRYHLNGLQAAYENEDTGVYFSFEYCSWTSPRKVDRGLTVIGTVHTPPG